MAIESDYRLVLLETEKVDYVFDKDLVILLCFLNKNISFAMTNREIEFISKTEGRKGKPVLHCELRPLKDGDKKDETMNYKLWPRKFASVWERYEKALDSIVRGNGKKNEYAKSIQNWLVKNNVEKIKACDEMVRVMLPEYLFYDKPTKKTTHKIEEEFVR